jgi:hypothetical protein
LLLAAVISLVGWVVTVGALGEQGEANNAVTAARPNEGAGHVPAQV